MVARYLRALILVNGRTRGCAKCIAERDRSGIKSRSEALDCCEE
jgi:hypothetical protein